MQYSQNIIDEIISDLSDTQNRLSENKVREYCKILDAIQEAITTQNPTKIEDIMKKSTKFNYYLSLIAKSIDYLQGLSGIITLKFVQIPTLPSLAMAVFGMLMSSIVNKLNTNSLVFYSNPLHEAVKKGGNSLQKATLIPNPRTIQKK